MSEIIKIIFLKDYYLKTKKKLTSEVLTKL